MAIAVLTVDQRSSRTQPDLVPSLVASLNRRSHADGLRRKFERTAGDEAQGVFSSAEAAVDSISVLLRTQGWNLGLGIGEAVEPLPRSTRAGRGEAFVNARNAVNRAKSGPHHVNVVGTDTYRAEQVETVLWLWSAILARRTDRGWEVADLLALGLSHREAADQLDISQSAVTQRAQAAGITEEQRARRLATELLAEALDEVRGGRAER